MELSRRKNHAEGEIPSREQDDPVTLFPRDDVPAPYEIPAEWTPEHVAHRMVAAFETLMAVQTGRVGPRRHANGWPTMLREFSDLVDEDAMKNARDAYFQSRRRPNADEISMMDEALGWPLQLVNALPLASDAVLTWSFCKAGGFSIDGLLRSRVAAAKPMVAKMQEHENTRVAAERKRVIIAAGQWRDRLAVERRIADLPPTEREARWGKMTIGMRNRIDRDLSRLLPKIIGPSDAIPGKVLSRSGLDRHLRVGLNLLSEKLKSRLTPIR